jgi:hypothetical protein
MNDEFKKNSFQEPKMLITFSITLAYLPDFQGIL